MEIPVDQPKTGWTPTGSTYAGSMAGAATILIVYLAGQFFPTHPIDAVTASALTTLIGGLASYVHADGGRK